MRIENLTKWKTAHLKAFVSRVAAVELTPEQRRKLKVEIVYNRAGKNQSYVSGCAYLRSNWMRVRVGAHQIDRINLAHTIAHEMAHTRGMQHSQMSGNPEYSRVGNWREVYAWADELPLETNAPKPKPDVQSVRFQRILNNIRNWETKFKRASNALKKLRKQKKYYEKVLAAKGSESIESNSISHFSS